MPPATTRFVLGECVEQLCRCQIVGFEPVEIDPDFKLLVAGTGDGYRLRKVDLGEFVLESLCLLDQRAFGHVAIDGDVDRALAGDVNFMDRRCGGIRWQVGGGAVHLGTDVLQGDVLVGVHVELQEGGDVTLGRGRGVVLQTVDILDAVFDRPRQQTLCVMRRHTRLRNRNIEIRNIDCRRNLPWEGPNMNMCRRG